MYFKNCPMLVLIKSSLENNADENLKVLINHLFLLWINITSIHILLPVHRQENKILITEY